MKHRQGWLIICFALFGCVQNEYDIELTPRGEKLERRFRVKRVANDSQEKVEADVARLAQEYGRKPPVANNEQRFAGIFTGRMPNDVGGHGHFIRYESPLGAVAVYMERFRGSDDLAGLIERRKQAVDHAVALLIGWLDMELKDDARWPAYQKFLHETFRRDMYNISLHLFLTPPSDDLNEVNDGQIELGLTVMHYLVEHEYLTPDEIPEWTRAFRASSEQDVDRLLQLCRNLILPRLDDGTQPPPELKFLQTVPQLEESLLRYLKTTEEYGIARNTWLEKRQTDPDAEEPDAFEILSDVMIAKNLEGLIQLGGDRLVLTLNLDRPAIYTNGDKVEDSTKLKWTEKPLPNAEALSSRVYAVWDEPNELAQKLIFGRTALAEESLLQYCLWYRGLTDPERTAWDDFLATLQPGPKFKEQIEAFRFPGEPAETETPLVAPAAEAIGGGKQEKPSDDEETP